MKTKSDPRHNERVAAVKSLFEASFSPKATNLHPLAENVYKKHTQTDRLLKKHAPAWPITQIAPVDLAILRLAIYELIFETKKEPYKVIVDEAVEIAKEFGSQSSASFVNGVLGSIIKSNIKNHG